MSSLRYFFILDGSDSIIFGIAGIGLSSLLGGYGQDLVTNRFADARKVLGHGVGPLDGVDITGRMAGVEVVAVLGIRVAGCCPSGKFCELGLECLPFLGALAMVWTLGNQESPEFLHWVHFVNWDWGASSSLELWPLGNQESPEFLHWVHCKLIGVL